MTDKLANVRARLAQFRSQQPQRPQPTPDPRSPHNPYHLPDSDMSPGRMPTREDVERRGGHFMQAKHTATLPNALVWNWPGRMTDALYQYCWDHHHGAGDLHAMLNMFSDAEIIDLLQKLETFNLEQLTAIGVDIYEGLIDQHERRRGPKTRIHVEPAQPTQAVAQFPADNEEEGQAEVGARRRIGFPRP